MQKNSRVRAWGIADRLPMASRMFWSTLKDMKRWSKPSAPSSILSEPLDFEVMSEISQNVLVGGVKIKRRRNQQQAAR